MQNTAAITEVWLSESETLHRVWLQRLAKSETNVTDNLLRYPIRAQVYMQFKRVEMVCDVKFMHFWSADTVGLSFSFKSHLHKHIHTYK